MTEHSLQILDSLSEIVPLLSDKQKEDLLSYGEMIAFRHSFNGTKSDHYLMSDKEETEQNAAGKSQL